MPSPLLRRALSRVGLTLFVCAPLASARLALTQEAAPENGAAIAPTAPAATTAATAGRKPLSPAERRAQTEEKLRALMVNLGISAAATQDAIIEYLATDELERANLREAEKRLMTGLRRDVPPERMRDLLADYRAAIDSEKANRSVAQRKLDARVGYSLDPKLEAILWLMGVLGDNASKLPTSALATPKPEAPDPNAPTAPVYGPPFNPNFGARGEIVGTVTAKGIAPGGEHWLEIRDDSGALDRYAALWREELKALDAEMDKQLADTPLSARVRVQWVFQERRRALNLQSENAPQTVTKVPTP